MVDDTLARLEGTAVFHKLDMTSGFWQILYVKSQRLWQPSLHFSTGVLEPSFLLDFLQLQNTFCWGFPRSLQTQEACRQHSRVWKVLQKFENADSHSMANVNSLSKEWNQHCWKSSSPGLGFLLILFHRLLYWSSQKILIMKQLTIRVLFISPGNIEITAQKWRPLETYAGLCINTVASWCHLQSSKWT